MKKRIIAPLLILLQLCGCGAEPKQEKAPVTPYSETSDIRYTKEVFSTELGLSSPNRIAISDDALFICDTGNSRVVKCDLRGNTINEFEFSEPVCVAAASSRICVYDRGSRKILLMTHSGEPIMEYRLEDDLNNMSVVTDVEIYGESIYFSLNAFDRHISSSGIYRISNGAAEKISDCTVGCLTSGGDGVYFMSKYELKDGGWVSGYAELLKITNADVKRISAFSDSYSAEGLAYYDGKLYAYNYCAQSIDEFSLDGEYIATVFSEPVVNDFVYRGFCSDSAGNFYLSDSAGNTIYRLVKQ